MQIVKTTAFGVVVVAAADVVDIIVAITVDVAVVFLMTATFLGSGITITSSCLLFLRVRVHVLFDHHPLLRWMVNGR